MQELSLTQQQELNALEQEYRQRVFYGKSNVEELNKWGKALYTTCGEELPVVLVTESPLSAQIVANLLPLLIVGIRLEKNYQLNLDGVFDSLNCIIDGSRYNNIDLSGVVDVPTRERAHLVVRTAWHQMKAQYLAWPERDLPEIVHLVCKEMEEKYPQVKALRQAKKSNHKIDLFSQFVEFAFDKLPEFYYPFSFASYGGIADVKWVAMYQYYMSIGQLEEKQFPVFRELLLSGIYDGIQLRGFYIICKTPKVLHPTANDRLSYTNGPAIMWDGDRVGYNFINGVHFNRHLYSELVANKMSAKDIILMQNQEQKVQAMRLVGYERILKEVGARVLDTHVVYIKGDTEPTTYELIECDLEDDQPGVPAKFVKVVCWSTHKVHYLRVDPRDPYITTAKAAVAWTAGLSEAEYTMLAET